MKISSSNIGIYSWSDILDRTNLFFVYMFVGILPFVTRFITYFIILWAIISISLAFLKRNSLKEIIKHSLLYLIFYSISILSLTYSVNFNYGIKCLETLVSIILMPFLILVFKRSENEKKTDFVLYAFISGLTLYVFISIIVLLFKMGVNSIIGNLRTDSLPAFARYYNLSFLQHPSYISMYLLWGIIMIVNRLFKFSNKRFSVIGFILLTIFTFYIVLMGSRAGLLTLLFVTIYYLWKFFKQYSLKISITITLISSLLLFFFILKYSRIGDTIMILNDKGNNITDIRISLWSDALEVVKDAPVFGHGIGDGLNKMVIKHYENGNMEAYRDKLNAHNQFLETATQTGILGFLSLVCILGIPIYYSLRDKKELLFLFIILIIFNFLFESMLERLSGVLFFGFWLNYLFLNKGNP